jgi:hypothetical protein
MRLDVDRTAVLTEGEPHFHKGCGALTFYISVFEKEA